MPSCRDTFIGYIWIVWIASSSCRCHHGWRCSCGVYTVIVLAARVRIVRGKACTAIRITIIQKIISPSWMIPRLWIGKAIATCHYIRSFGRVVPFRGVARWRDRMYHFRSPRRCWIYRLEEDWSRFRCTDILNLTICIRENHHTTFGWVVKEVRRSFLKPTKRVFKIVTALRKILSYMPSCRDTFIGYIWIVWIASSSCRCHHGWRCCGCGVYTVIDLAARVRITGGETCTAIRMTTKQEIGTPTWIIPRLWICKAIATCRCIRTLDRKVPFCIQAGGWRDRICRFRSHRRCWGNRLGRDWSRTRPWCRKFRGLYRGRLSCAIIIYLTVIPPLNVKLLATLLGSVK